MVARLSPALLLVATFGCAHARAVRTARAGETRLVFEDGGPLVTGVGERGAFFPLSSAGVALRHGVGGAAEVHAAVRLPPLAFGVAWLEVGASARVFGERGARPYLLATAALHVATNGPRWIVAGQLTLVASWTAKGGRVVPYLGWDSVVGVFPGLGYLGTALVGVRVGERVWLSPELRWFAPWRKIEPVSGRPLALGRGALGVGLAVGVRL